MNCERALLAITGAFLALFPVGCKNSRGEAPPAAVRSAPPEGLGGAPELQLDYSIVLNDNGTGRRVGEKYHFRSGDQFRIEVRPAFAAYVYLLNRGPREANYAFLFPAPKEFENALPQNRVIALPRASEWFTLDNKPGVENVLLIASAHSVMEFNTPERSIQRDEFEDRIALVERDGRPASSRRFEDQDWVKVFAAPSSRMASPQNAPDKTVIVLRLPLDHR
jgi:hypothetical protein